MSKTNSSSVYRVKKGQRSASQHCRLEGFRPPTLDCKAHSALTEGGRRMEFCFGSIDDRYLHENLLPLHFKGDSIQ